MEQKQRYTQEALAAIPHILELLDRSPVSKTYGCFDREYWHYKAKDFPSGMYEECVLSLALVYANDFKDNIYFNNPRIKEYVIAGINFARGRARKNGSTDDYYPNEEALGATAFSLYACTEAYLLLNLKDSKTEHFFKRRARFIAEKNESGTLANHHALAALALYNVFLITADATFQDFSKEKIKETLSYQSPEGWFKEYEGCDVGYLTFTIDFLAKYLQKNPEHTEVADALKKAVNFCFLTIHPDGSYGGEYGSRNTSHFLPNGFEILASQLPEAAYMRTLFLKSLEQKINSRIDDDRIFNHYIYNYIQAFLNHAEAPVAERPEHEHYFEDAGLHVRNKDGFFFICSTKKGGVFKLFNHGKLVASDCGLILEETSGRKIVSQTWANNHVSLSDSALEISSRFHLYSQVLPSPFKQWIFRALTLTVSKLFPGAMRIILQKILITGKSPTNAKLQRNIVFKSGELEVTDTINASGTFNKMYIPSDFTGMYVASGQAYTQSTLMPWQDYSTEVETLNKTGTLTITRKL